MKARELLAACFLLFGALLIWPLLTIANRPVLIWGVPALVLYLFAVWAAIVAVLIAPAGASAGAGGRRVTWLGQPTLPAILLGYLIFLFLVASAGEAFAHRLARWRIRTVTYVLAASVYCTAWTFYASVGLAANRGLEFLTIYLGPACVALLWPG